MTGDTLHYVHIGKCGGSTLGRGLRASPVVRQRFAKMVQIHLSRPVYEPDGVYAIPLRNPVGRAISAFNWRYKLVVLDKEQSDRFPGEREILTRYGSLDALATSLYSGDSLNVEAAEDYRSIHHLREGIAFYLQPLVGKLRREQVFAIFLQETLDHDMLTQMRVANELEVRRNTALQDRQHLTLNPTALANLRRLLAEDYACIDALNVIGALSDKRKALLTASDDRYLRGSAAQ